MNEDVNLTEMIENEVLSFDCVSRFADASLTENINQAVLRRSDVNPSVRISADDDQLTINLEIIVYYGTNIPQLCYDLQSRVKKHIEQTTGKTVKAVNIKVEGIDEH